MFVFHFGKRRHCFRHSPFAIVSFICMRRNWSLNPASGVENTWQTLTAILFKATVNNSSKIFVIVNIREKNLPSFYSCMSLTLWGLLAKPNTCNWLYCFCIQIEQKTDVVNNQKDFNWKFNNTNRAQSLTNCMA